MHTRPPFCCTDLHQTACNTVCLRLQALTAPLHSSAAPESRLAAFKVLQPQHLDTVQSDWKTAAKQKLLQMPSHIRDALSTARTMDVIDARDELIDSMTRVLEAYETDRESEEKFRALRDQVTITVGGPFLLLPPLTSDLFKLTHHPWPLTGLHVEWLVTSNIATLQLLDFMTNPDIALLNKSKWLKWKWLKSDVTRRLLKEGRRSDRRSEKKV